MDPITTSLMMGQGFGDGTQHMDAAVPQFIEIEEYKSETKSKRHIIRRDRILRVEENLRQRMTLVYLEQGQHFLIREPFDEFRDRLMGAKPSKEDVK